MDLTEMCKDLVDEVDEALGAAVVDLDSGLLLGAAHNVPYFTQSYLDAVAAAAVEMFRGRNVSNVENLLSGVRGVEMKNSIKELQTATPETYHFFAQVPDKPGSLFVLITGKKANLGMGWSALRNVLPKAAPLCP